MDRPLALGILMQLHLLHSLCSPVLQAKPEVRAVVGEDCVLRCTAPPASGVQYIAVTWYKVSSGNVSGLLARQGDEVFRYEGAEEEVHLREDSHDIVLHNVTCGNSGLYKCHLTAPVGELNQEGEIHLIVTDCPAASSETVAGETYIVIFAAAILVLALPASLICYVILSRENLLKSNGSQMKKVPVKETPLDVTRSPLDKQDLMLVSTLGPKQQKKPTMEYVYV